MTFKAAIRRYLKAKILSAEYIHIRNDGNIYVKDINKKTKHSLNIHDFSINSNDLVLYKNPVMSLQEPCIFY